MKRNFGIDMAKICAMIGILLLHILGKGARGISTQIY